ncbi:cysteine desulfurase family protein [Methylophaga sp. OBS4]|uniref:cysteine desulfurase family protein n=1 Tax=Methylophaga sp. OBS4 TaxID=2991935 RepID=UPI00225315DA|nr:cysteine desulfurase family protein [Methylophaga sp. OBS4]MCX4187135.1 cysteine desulfurase [Methylophaga sp. OBS4]
MSFTYLDNNAGAGLADDVLDAMLPYLQQQQGNPSSSHRFGRFAHSALDKARQQVADLVNAEPSQIIFTSGGTEANNQAIAGIAELYQTGKILISAIEHPSMLEPARRLARHGFVLEYIPVDNNGLVKPETLASMIDDDTRLVSVMWANNETGVVQDIPALAAVCREKAVPFMSDAVQAAGKLDLDFKASGVQLMTLSAHKFGGPKGIGALIVAADLDWPGYILGGGQEEDKRSGTENVAAIVGFGAAAQQVKQQLPHYQQHCRQLRDLLEQKLHEIPGITIFAEQAERLPNTVFFSLQGFDSDTLLMSLDRQGYAVSSGSACGTGQQTPSHVLKAMGIDDVTALGAVRVSVSQHNTKEQIEQLAVVLGKEAGRFNHLMNR